MDESEIYHRLAPYIQDYVYAQGWSELRPVQVAAARVLFGSEDHLLLSSGTASGKTEAAFLPALTLLAEQPSRSVGILYVSPLKALINDQFARLRGLLEAGGIPVTKWHGDAPAAGKARVVREPEGLLQITPESLESLLMNRGAACARLFSDLRFVIVDEVHYFMASERGVQLQCLLARIERLAGCAPRRIGLSATLGDPEGAVHWLSAGTGRPCRHPEAPEPRRRLLLWMRYFVPGEDPGEPGLDAMLYRQTLGKKTIVFTKSRLEAEHAIAGLKRTAARLKSPDVYRVHHGSISAALREQAEHDMKRSPLPIVTGATVTLELGLDIGDLDRVVQLGAPVSASSFTQRIGRCGRQGQPAELLFLLQGEADISAEPLSRGAPDDSRNPEEIVRIPPAGGKEQSDRGVHYTTNPTARIDWDFIKAIAVVQLYLEERWVEPIAPRRQCFGLAYHQTMCILAAAGELLPAKLAQEVLTLPAFQHIAQEDLRTLYRHLLDTNHLQWGDAGGLMIGPAGEPVVTGYDFLAVFTAPEEYQVRYRGAPIGTVTEACQPGERIALAGRSWEVVKCDESKRILTVTPAKGQAETRWESYAVGNMHGHLLARMRRVLAEDMEYAYLSPESRVALRDMRAAARQTGIAEGPRVVPLTPSSYLLVPWLGTPALQALRLALKTRGIATQVLPGGFTPVYLQADRCGEGELRRALRGLRREGIDPDSLPVTAKMRPRSKFDPFLPEELLRRQAREECLDCEGAMEWLEQFPSMEG